MSIAFVTVASQIMQTEEVDTVFIPLVDSMRIKLYNVALAMNCYLNLILLEQLQKSGILYHNNPKIMTLIRDQKIIAHAKKYRNFITFDRAMYGQLMSIITKIITLPEDVHVLTLSVRRNASVLGIYD